jgi:Zn-dependent protease
MNSEHLPPAAPLDAHPPLDPLTAQVLAELDKPPARGTWVQSAVLLAITLAVFAMTGVFQNTRVDLAILIAVILFHESGHYLGMRLFNYQDVKMFFIPFFGAAVAGRSTSVQGYKEAIVLLLGPVPGIVLGVIAGTACLVYDNQLLRTTAMMLLFLNGFNLLPLLPLDGGRLLHLIVFSRQRHLELAFRVIAALLLGLCAWGMGSFLLGGLAVFILLGTQLNYYVSKLAQELRGPLAAGGEINLTGRIPHDQAVPLVERVRQTFRTQTQPKGLALIARQVWERMHLRPPGLAASLALLLVYAVSFIGTPVAAIAFMIPRTTVVTVANPDGSQKRRQEQRVWGALKKSTEIGEDGDPHGRHVEYDPFSGRVQVEGLYVRGFPIGPWTYYDANGKVERQELFVPPP